MNLTVKAIEDYDDLPYVETKMNEAVKEVSREENLVIERELHKYVRESDDISVADIPLELHLATRQVGNVIQIVHDDVTVVTIKRKFENKPDKVSVNYEVIRNY